MKWNLEHWGFGKAYIPKGLSMEGNLHFKINCLAL